MSYIYILHDVQNSIINKLYLVAQGDPESIDYIQKRLSLDD